MTVFLYYLRQAGPGFGNNYSPVRGWGIFLPERYSADSGRRAL